MFDSSTTTKDALQLACGLAMVACLIALSGCSDSNHLDTKYGKVNEKPRSINSTSLFAERLEELGYDVTVRNRISPKINDFDTVFWFPENPRCPSDRATEAIENWMNEGYGYDSKTLVYVGADYRADEDYYQAIQESMPPELQAEGLRLLSEAQLATQRRKNSWNQDDYFGTSNTSCDWFDIEAIKPRKSNLLDGPIATDAGFSVAPELPIEVMMSPNISRSSSLWEKESLLTVDDEDMVYQLVQRNEFCEKRIIVVQNASFLVNFAAADPNKQALADQLISTACRTTDDSYYGYDLSVLILESELEIPIRNTDFVNENSWAWIAEEPLCYFVPNALFWGVLFCFVCFPIFGRPRRLTKRSTTSFRNHINAVAKQLSRSGGTQHAHKTIEQYQDSLTGSNKTGFNKTGSNKKNS